jgi:hypothetical protein
MRHAAAARPRRRLARRASTAASGGVRPPLLSPPMPSPLLRPQASQLPRASATVAARLVASYREQTATQYCYLHLSSDRSSPCHELQHIELLPERLLSSGFTDCNSLVDGAYSTRLCVKIARSKAVFSSPRGSRAIFSSPRGSRAASRSSAWRVHFLVFFLSV